MSVRINVLASWAGHVATTAVGFFLMPYVIHAIGDTSYGTWVFLNAIAGYTGLLYLGFGETISRYVSQHYARREWERLNEVVSGVFAAYFVSGFIALLGGVILAAIAPWILDGGGGGGGQSFAEVQAVIVILGLTAALSITGSINGGVLYGIQRFDLERGIIVAGMLAKLGLTLLFLTDRYSLITLALISLAHTALEQLVYYVAARRLVPTLRIRLRHVKRSVVKESYGFAALSGIGLVATKLIYDTDYIVIGLALGNAAIVPYAIGSRLCEMIRRPIQQIGEVFLPRASELNAKADQQVLQSLVCKGMGVAFLLSAALFIGGWYFGAMLIQLWMGAGYETSRWVFLLLIAAQIAASPAGVLHMVLVGVGDVRVPSFLRMAQAILNLVLSLLLVKPLGVVGVALGTMIPILVVDLFVLLPYGIRRFEITPRYVLRHAVAPYLLPLAALWAYSHVVSGIGLEASWPVLLAVTAGGGIVLALTWAGVWLVTERCGFSPNSFGSRLPPIDAATELVETV
ncbi:MAG: lipopolysaccharide biosynthesis protein [Planctomycetaceae bacterium]